MTWTFHEVYEVRCFHFLVSVLLILIHELNKFVHCKASSFPPATSITFFSGSGSFKLGLWGAQVPSFVLDNRMYVAIIQKYDRPRIVRVKLTI